VAAALCRRDQRAGGMGAAAAAAFATENEIIKKLLRGYKLKKKKRPICARDLCACEMLSYATRPPPPRRRY